MTHEAIKMRSALNKYIRLFFESRDYLEVETPLLSPDLIPESNIEVFKSTSLSPFKKPLDMYLTPSPEIWMKRFLSENPVNIYQISRAFRNSEQSGKHHNPEFTMLEYYTMGFDDKDSMNLTRELISWTAEKLNCQVPEFTALSMDEAFITCAGFSLEKNISLNALRERAHERDITTDPEDSWESVFNRIFLNLVEPELEKIPGALFLYNYPSALLTLSRDIPQTPWSQRWELYMNGIEVANCYAEETDPQKVKEFFKEESRLKEASLQPHNVDNDYYRIFSEDFPRCSGVAIGVDRLMMVLGGIQDIKGVILFPFSDIIQKL